MSPAIKSALDWALPILMPPFIALVIQGIRYLGARVHLTMTDTQQRQLQYALEQGVAAAAERYRKVGGGEVKAAFALDQARALAPDAMAKVQPEQQRVLVEATYAKLRPSLPTPSEAAGDDIPVDVVEVPAAPTPLPRPKVRPS